MYLYCRSISNCNNIFRNNYSNNLNNVTKCNIVVLSQKKTKYDKCSR